MTLPLEQRILENIELSDSGCWLWGLAKFRSGYGRITVDRRSRVVHRVVYETLVGPVPEGLELDHLCRVRHCVNPAHLECVPHQINIQRGDTGANSSKKTHCPQGHPYAGDNLKITSRGVRRCLICARKQWRKGTRKYKARKRAERKGTFSA